MKQHFAQDTNKYLPLIAFDLLVSVNAAIFINH